MAPEATEETDYLKQNYIITSLANVRSTLREMPGFEDDYENWTEGDFTYGNGAPWIGVSNKSVICPSPRHDPDYAKEPQYTVKFLRKHLPDSVFKEMLSDYQDKVDHEAKEVKIPQETVEREAKKIDDILEDKLSEESAFSLLKQVLAPKRGRLEKPSNFTTMKNFVLGSKEYYQPPVQEASIIHRSIPNYNVSVQD